MSTKLKKLADQVLVITGASSGIGLATARSAAEQGGKVGLAARSDKALKDVVAAINASGGDAIGVVCDVSERAQVNKLASDAVAKYGRIDTWVNTAGLGMYGRLDETDEGDAKRLFEVNFWGVVNVTRAALPVMRGQRSGHILQISSVGGRLGMPGLSAYQAAKWAVGGFTEVVAQEVAPLGIKICAVEPGGMRTNWAVRAGQGTPTIIDDYLPSVGAIRELLGTYAGNEPSDPDRIAQILLKLAYHEQLPLHLLIGNDALQYCGQAETARAEAGERWLEVSRAADYSAPVELPAFPSH